MFRPLSRPLSRGLSRPLNGPISSVALDLDLARLGVLDPRISFSRSTSKTNLLYTMSSGAYDTFVGGVPCFISGLGFLPEEQRVQSFGSTDTPATQTLTLSAGTYTHWMIGSGSVTSAAGTAVGSGFGAATQGVFKTITVTTGGTVVFTVAGAVLRMQCENGAFPTSYIPNPGAVGTSVTRSADVATMTLASIGIPANPAGLTIIGKARTAAGVDSVKTQVPLQIDDGTTSNRILVRRTTSGTVTLGEAGGTSPFSGTLAGGATAANTDLALWLALTASNSAAQIIGQSKITDAAMTALPGPLTTLRLGIDQTGASLWNSTIARLQIYNRRLPDAQAAAIAASL